MKDVAKPKCAKVTDAAWTKILHDWYDPLVTVEAIAATLKISPTALRRWMHNAGVPRKSDITPATANQYSGLKRREDVLKEHIISRTDAKIGAIPVNTTIVRPPKFKKARGDEETQIALLSDTHPGVKTPSFDAAAFAERMERHTHGLIRIAELHRNAYPIKKLVMFCLGDLVNGEKVGRNVNSEEFECPVDDQLLEHFVPAYSKMLLTLLENYSEIHIHSVPGNHGSPAGKESAYGTNWDVIAMELVKAHLRNHADRLHFDVERKNFFKIVEVEGHWFLLMHGDQIPMHMTVPYYGLTTRALRLHSALPSRSDLVRAILESYAKGGMAMTPAVDALSRLPFQYLCCGHIHTPNYLEFNDIHIYTNGTYKSGDRFPLQKMGMAGTPRQWTFGVHRNKGVTWEYRITLV